MSYLLDVTLRDGGYQNLFHFHPQRAARLARELGQAGVDFIEIGYRNGSLKPIAGAGPAALCQEAYLRTLRKHAPEAKLAVMVHPHNVTTEDLEDLRKNGIDMIRVCMNQKDLIGTAATIKKARELGFLTTANITRITYLDLQTASHLAQFAEENGAHVVYFADSNGNLIPSEVDRITKTLKACVSIPIGFHAHNNLSMALANTMAAREAGATFIDSSIKGMGKGAGNLATEIYATYLNRLAQGGKQNLVRILEIAQNWEIEMAGVLQSLTVEELFLGAANFSAEFIPLLREAAVRHGISWPALAFALGERSPRVASLSEIELLALRLQDQKGSDANEQASSIA